MVSIRERLASLRAEADAAVDRAEFAEARAKSKALERTILNKDQEITSLSGKIAAMEADLEKAKKQSELAAKKLRQVDVKAEHFEKQVQRLEQERNQWEKKFEEARAQQRPIETQLQELDRIMENS